MIKWMISSSCLILIMIVIRKLFKGKISSRLQYALWLLVAIRLLVPVNLGNSVLSIENFTNHLTIQKQKEVHENTAIREEFNNASDRIKVFESIETINVDQNLQSNYNETHKLPYEDIISEKYASKIDVSKFLFDAWMAGANIVTLVFISSNVVFGKRVRNTRILLENTVEKLPVYVSSAVETPCLYGIIHPAIYVTNTVAEEKKTFRHAIAHELTHYTHGDLWWSLIRCVCLILHWYNPLVWWAAKISKQDGELACDEATIQKLGEEERLAYGKTLISLTCEKRQDLFVAATTMTSDKKNIKERIGRIAKKTKVTIYTFVGVLLISMIAVGCTFTGAKEKNITDTSVSEILCVNPEENGLDFGDITSNAVKIIEKANAKLREGYVDAKLTYVDNAEVGWDYYSDNPWSSETERDDLAQAALKELYTLTGYNVEECTYTTDGRSRFIFGKSGDYIRKCIAFYSRDFGCTLCGDSVPYQGYMNARKFHYSDVQQLESPYEKNEYSDLKSYATWYLEHSGVYQGETITNYEEINLDDTVYTHIKLTFDGGYFVVVMNESIETVSEIMGPYYEMEKDTSAESENTSSQMIIKNRSYETVIQDEVYRYAMTDFLENGVFPATTGVQCNGDPLSARYAVQDIDGDGREELLLSFPDAETIAGMTYFIYDYDRKTGKIYIQNSGYPNFTIFDNGYIKQEASHNHGRSNLDDFWPYQLYIYNTETDYYESIAFIDAWQEQRYPEDEPDPEFPKEKDVNGDGVVYYDGSGDFMDNEEYKAWCAQYNQGNEINIQWYLAGGNI